MAKKIYLKHIYTYPKEEVYSLAHTLGRRLLDYLSIDLFLLLLDARILLGAYDVKKLQCISDRTYQIHPAAKALEGFLEKVIKGKKLRVDKGDKIGEVFGKKDEIVREKIRDKRLIAKTKSVWDFCRNDVMHYSPQRKLGIIREWRIFDDIVEIIVLLFKDFYGKTEPDDEISEGFKKYFSRKKVKLTK